jgi:16S rRNA (cytidine1402-2'-O)-methyltransferase
MSGRLILCATPIGNLDDASRRLQIELESADVVFAEDTRRSQILLRHFGIERRLRSFFVGNEATRVRELREALAEGATVALITDAGMPTIADPGHSAVQAAIEAGAVVTVVPGPSAVTAAIAVSGLPAERFVFEGFLPRKGSARGARLKALAEEKRTVVMFAAPSRLVKDLGSLVGVLGSTRRLAVVRELTKMHEEVWRGTLGEAVARWSEEVEPRGEFTLVVAGGEPAAPPSWSELEAEVVAESSAGRSKSDAVRSVAKRYGVSRRELYSRAATDPDDA